MGFFSRNKSEIETELPSGIQAKPVHQLQVTISRSRLQELKDHQGLLNDYVDWYISCTELFSVCEKTRERLQRPVRDPGKLTDQYHWTDVKGDLETMQKKAAEFSEKTGPGNRMSIETLKTTLNKAQAVADSAASGRLDEEQLIKVTDEAIAAIDRMLIDLVDFVAKIQYATRTELSEVGKIMERISGWVEATSTAELTQAPNMTFAGHAGERGALPNEPPNYLIGANRGLTNQPPGKLAGIGGERKNESTLGE